MYTAFIFLWGEVIVKGRIKIKLNIKILEKPSGNYLDRALVD